MRHCACLLVYSAWCFVGIACGLQVYSLFITSSLAIAEVENRPVCLGVSCMGLILCGRPVHVKALKATAASCLSLEQRLWRIMDIINYHPMKPFVPPAKFECTDMTHFQSLCAWDNFIVNCEWTSWQSGAKTCKFSVCQLVSNFGSYSFHPIIKNPTVSWRCFWLWLFLPGSLSRLDLLISCEMIYPHLCSSALILKRIRVEYLLRNRRQICVYVSPYAYKNAFFLCREKHRQQQLTLLLMGLFH